MKQNETPWWVWVIHVSISMATLWFLVSLYKSRSSPVAVQPASVTHSSASVSHKPGNERHERSVIAADTSVKVPQTSQALGRQIISKVAWMADDFVVELYHNGRLVPLDVRTLEEEIFGATRESCRLAVKEGDWLVFHVVNNRMRWGGARLFVAALLHNDEPILVTQLDEKWSYCEKLENITTFIGVRDEGFGEPIKQIPAEKVWDGIGKWQSQPSGGYGAVPIWGQGPSTWIKVRIPTSSLPKPT